MVKGAHGMLDQNPIYASEQFLKAEIHFTFAWTRTWVLHYQPTSESKALDILLSATLILWRLKRNGP